MKAVILAAGEGKRLSKCGWHKPKCLLPWADGTILDNILLSIRENNISKIIVVIGYEPNRIKEQIARYDFEVQYVYNEEYATTNTINSLWRAAGFIDEDFLCFNADIVFDKQIISKLLKSQSSALALEIKKCGAEEVKIVIDSENRIHRIGKDLPLEKCAGEFIGIAAFRYDIWPDFKKTLHYYNEVRNEKNLFFEVAVDEICSTGNIFAVDIKPYHAMEIDTPEDFEALQSRIGIINKNSIQGSIASDKCIR